MIWVMKHGDDIAAATGGVLMAILGQVSFASVAETMLLAFLGGFIGILAKKTGESIWEYFFGKDEKED